MFFKSSNIKSQSLAYVVQFSVDFLVFLDGDMIFYFHRCNNKITNWEDIEKNKAKYKDGTFQTFLANSKPSFGHINIEKFRNGKL
jgi:hypothetical protein